DLLVNPAKGSYRPIKIRSLVGLSTIFASSILRRKDLDKLPTFTQGIKWFYDYRRRHYDYQVLEEYDENEDILLSLVPKTRLKRLINAMIDPEEFYSPF